MAAFVVGFARRGKPVGMLATFLEIRPRERIVYAYTVRTDGISISSSLVTVEFIGTNETTMMTFTEQAVFVDAADGDVRESGTGFGFERLCHAMLEDGQVRQPLRAYLSLGGDAQPIRVSTSDFGSDCVGERP